MVYLFVCFKFLHIIFQQTTPSPSLTSPTRSFKIFFLTCILLLFTTLINTYHVMTAAILVEDQLQLTFGLGTSFLGARIPKQVSRASNSTCICLIASSAKLQVNLIGCFTRQLRSRVVVDVCCNIWSLPALLYEWTVCTQAGKHREILKMKTSYGYIFFSVGLLP